MTVTDTDAAQAIIRSLAEMPCPKQGNVAACGCKGLAFLWASEECERCGGSGELDKGPNPEHCTWCRSGRVPKADLGLAELVLHLGQLVEIDMTWECPHEFEEAKEESNHFVTPCSEATHIVHVSKLSGGSITGTAEGPVLDTDLLLLAALKAVEAKAGMR